MSVFRFNCFNMFLHSKYVLASHVPKTLRSYLRLHSIRIRKQVMLRSYSKKPVCA